MSTVAGKAVRGMAWNLVTSIGVQIVQIVGTLALTRYIVPDEYGNVQNAAICMITGGMFSTLALGQYIIAKKATPEECWHATVIHVGLGTVALLLVLALHEPLEIWLDSKDILRYMPGIGLGLWLGRFQYVPEKLLARALRFRTVAVLRALGELLFTVVAVGMAPDHGGMAIVYANIARGGFVAVTMTWAADRQEWFVPGKGLEWPTVRRLVLFGAPISVGSFAEYMSTRWTNLIVSHHHSTEAAGRYGMAFSLAELPTGAVADQIGNVLMPSLAKLEPEDRVRATLRASALMGLLVFPLAVGLAAVAPAAVAALLADEWRGVAPLLIVLSVVSVTKPMTWVISAFALAQQRARLMMIQGFVKAGLSLVAVAFIGHFGVMWVCVGVGVALLLHAFYFLWSLSSSDGISIAGFLAAVIPPFLATLPMAGAVLGVRWLLLQNGWWDGWWLLIVQVSVGTVAYVGSAFVLARSAAWDFVGLVRTKLLRRG